MVPFTQKHIMKYLFEANDDAQMSQREPDKGHANEVNRTRQRTPE